MVSRYQKRISGPLMDRIDIHVEVPRVDYDKLCDDRLGELSEAIRQRVEAARETQKARFEGKGLICNADMGVAEVREFCGVDSAGCGLLRAAMTQSGMSARSYHRILQLARTIASLEGAKDIATHHLAEAIQYQPRVRGHNRQYPQSPSLRVRPRDARRQSLGGQAPGNGQRSA